MVKRLKILVLIFIGGLLIFATSCKKKKICAAYNSYFAYDASKSGYYFSSFGAGDSIPGDRKTDRFTENGTLKKSSKRKDQSLNNIKIKEFKEAISFSNDTSLAENDSNGAILRVEEFFKEKINTDQEAYDHYVGKLLKEYQEKNPKPKEPVDSTFSKPSKMTKEEKAAWKKEKKERKQREKEERKQKKEENTKNKEKEEEEEFDLDLEEE